MGDDMEALSEILARVRLEIDRNISSSLFLGNNPQEKVKEQSLEEEFFQRQAQMERLA